MRCNQRHLRRLQAQNLAGTQIGFRLRLIGLRCLRPQDRIPRHARALRHIRQQQDIAVGKRRDEMLGLQADQTRNGIGPGVQAMPGAVQPLKLLRTYARYAHAEILQDAIEVFAMQHIKPREGAAAAAHFFHGGLVALAPGIGEAMRINIAAPMAGQEGPCIARDTVAPIHYRAKNIEDQGLNLGKRAHAAVSFSGTAHFFSKSQTSGKPMSSVILAKP